MSRQYTTPLLLSGPDHQTVALERVTLEARSNGEVTYNEQLIQDLLFDHPSLIPVSEIEPALTPLLPVCTELPTPVGLVDNLFITPSGHLVIAECKLWRNAQARREVLAQALDYASALAAMSLEELAIAIGKAYRRADTLDLWQLVERDTDLQENEFYDALRRNLSRGRVLLLLVGDGIREEMEALSDFMQAHAGLHFTLALLELALYRVPSTQDLLVQPRVQARTVMIERGIVRVEDGQVRVQAAEQSAVSSKRARAANLSMEEFYERLRSADADLPDRLQRVIDRLEEEGVETDVRRGLILRWRTSNGIGVNLGTIYPERAEVWTDMIHHHGDQLGVVDFTAQYVKELAETTGARVRYISTTDRPWLANDDGTPISLAKLLDHDEAWLTAIRSFMQRVRGRIELNE